MSEGNGTEWERGIKARDGESEAKRRAMGGDGSARRVFMGRGGERTRQAVRTMECGAPRELARGTRNRDGSRAEMRCDEMR